MIAFERLLQRELRVAMLMVTAGIVLAVGLLVALNMWLAVRNEVLLVEGFVNESSRNVLVYEEPLMLQRSAAEFWRAMVARDSIMSGLSIYLDGQWIVSVGEVGSRSFSISRDLNPISGRVLKVTLNLSIIPLALRLAWAELTVIVCAALVYLLRVRKARAEMRKVIGPINREISRLHNLDANAPTFLSGDNEFQIIEVEQLREAYSLLLDKMSEINELQRERDIAEAQRIMAAQVAHDMRSPIGFLNIIIQRPKQIDENIQNIRRAVDRLNEISADLLKNHVPTKSVFEILPVINEILDEKVQEKARIQVKAECPDLKVFAQVGEFKRVFSNLLNNALEATRAKGEVVVAIRRFDLNKVEIEIRDSGVGMEPEVLNKIGQVGFSHGKSGHGLGVSYALRKVQSWQGEMLFESEPRVGTKVILRLMVGA